MTRSHVILYDGVCGLCNRFVQFVLPRDHKQVFRFASLQSDVGRAFLQRLQQDSTDLNTVYVVTDADTKTPALLSQAEAVLFILAQLTWPWRWFRLARVLPQRLLRWLYKSMSRNRYRFFGQTESCMRPPIAYKDRFLDT